MSGVSRQSQTTASNLNGTRSLPSLRPFRETPLSRPRFRPPSSRPPLPSSVHRDPNFPFGSPFSASDASVPRRLGLSPHTPNSPSSLRTPHDRPSPPRYLPPSLTEPIPFTPKVSPYSPTPKSPLVPSSLLTPRVSTSPTPPSLLKSRLVSRVGAPGCGPGSPHTGLVLTGKVQRCLGLRGPCRTRHCDRLSPPLTR